MAAKHQRSRFFLDSGIYDGLASFAELEARVTHLPINKDKGDAFEVFAEAYLATQNITPSKHIWPFESLPPSIAQDLQLDTGRDMGVDGVIETPLGQFDAYQVKFRTDRPKLTWDELSTFMGLTDQVSQRILFTNCDDFPKLMNDRTGFFCIRGSDLDRLEKGDFDTIRQWLCNGIIKTSRKHPLPHQTEALDAILPALEQQDRATAVMACGTGKTLVALWVAERMQCTSVVVLLPSLSLVRQTLHEWLKETAWPKLSYLCICSDPSVIRGADSVIVQQSDLDFPVTTDKDAIRKFLDSDYSGVRIVFSTYQSAHLLGAAMEGRAPFDLGIFDEAHKTTGRQGAKFGFALSDDNLTIHKRLFLTATPRHYNINKKNKEGDAALVYSMDATDIYGPIAFTLSFAKAAEQGIICDYKVVISIVTSEMLGRELIQRSEVLVEGDAVKAQQVANQVAISQAVEKYGVNRIFSFHASVASARSFTSDKGEGIGSHLPGFDAFHVNGAMPTSKRAHMMKAFADAERAVISNARCLTEGVDVPAVDMVAFMSPKKSKVDIVQATGRAMRKSPGKSVGYVLIPLFLEMENEETVEEALERTGLEDIWNVLQAMQEQDEALVDVIRQMREDKGRTGGFNDARLREKIETLGPDLSLETLQNTISAACVDRLGITWDERFGEVKTYNERFGDCNVPLRWDENNRLGRWTVNQRMNKKKGRLSKSRIAKLDGIGFIWDTIVDAWRKSFEELVKYKRRFGNSNVPVCWPENLALGIWVHHQRSVYKAGSLDRKNIEKLDTLGFVWDQKDSKWNEMYELLKEFKDFNGNCNVPQRRGNNGGKLGVWVATQRFGYKNGTLGTQRITLLNNIGFVWDQKDNAWNEMLAALIKYKESHGGCNVSSVAPETKDLGMWVQRQRNYLQKGKLTKTRESKLNSIGFVWDQKDSAWDEMFAEFTAYKHEHGDCNVPVTWKKNNNLGNWVNTQRNKWRDSSLSEEHVRTLTDLGFIFELGSSWDDRYKELCEFVHKYGNCKIPSTSGYFSKLLSWSRNQRSNRKSGSLRQDRIEKLDELGFIWDTTEAAWDEMLESLKEFKRYHEHFNVPANWPDNPKLGRWVSTQRQNYKKDKLTPDQIKCLDTMGFVWDALDAAWNEMFSTLIKYKEDHGDCNVPARWPKNSYLGSWVQSQRSACKTGMLDRKRIAKLDALDFVWDKKDSEWNEMFATLVEYKKDYGNCNVPSKYLGDLKLGGWVGTQRQNYKKGKLTPDKIKRLDMMGFVWNTLDAAWYRSCSDLIEYRKVHGDCNVPDGWKDNPQLARWVAGQRAKMKKGRLSKNKIQQLNYLDFIWDIRDAVWNAMYAELVDYLDLYGDCNLPNEWPESPQLAKWVKRQREEKIKGALGNERTKRLESIGFYL